MFYKELFSFVLCLLIPMSKGAIPGTFFWRPRLGIDLAIPSTEPSVAAFQPNKANIHAGIVVLIDGYDIITSLIGLMSGIQFASEEETMNPTKGIYYTGAYRWTLRAVSLFPHWLRGNFHDALAVWRNRFKFMDAQVPRWMRKALPWVPAATWDQENINLMKFRKYSEAAFSPFYRFPSKHFDNFRSFMDQTKEAFVFSSEQELDQELSKANTLGPPDAEKKQDATSSIPTTLTPTPPPIGK